MHENGEAASGPIALVEVQGYKYAALHGAAEIAERLGRGSGRELRAAAARLRERFQRDFWLEDDQFHALALDGEGAPCRVISSNPAHCLWTGLVKTVRAQPMVGRLLGPELFSGWGVRTLASRERRYNPMSYHNGSVWPHDNALIGLGLARHGETAGSERILTALFEASRAVEASRLPELMCGFSRQMGEAPTLYPVACSPQAWAAGSVFLLLQGLLGLSIHAERRQVRLRRPRMPNFLTSLTIRHLQVGDGELDLFLDKSEGEVVVRVLRRTSSVDVVLS
jgi:glycogen debranching enzyme